MCDIGMYAYAQNKHVSAHPWMDTLGEINFQSKLGLKTSIFSFENYCVGKKEGQSKRCEDISKIWGVGGESLKN